jgi:hypothetical protein
VFSHFRRGGFESLIRSFDMLYNIRYYLSKNVMCLKYFAVDKTGSDWSLLKPQFSSDDPLYLHLGMVMRHRERLEQDIAWAAKKTKEFTEVLQGLQGSSSEDDGSSTEDDGSSSEDDGLFFQG